MKQYNIRLQITNFLFVLKMFVRVYQKCTKSVPPAFFWYDNHMLLRHATHILLAVSSFDILQLSVIILNLRAPIRHHRQFLNAII